METIRAFRNSWGFFACKGQTLINKPRVKALESCLTARNQLAAFAQAVDPLCTFRAALESPPLPVLDFACGDVSTNGDMQASVSFFFSAFVSNHSQNLSPPIKSLCRSSLWHAVSLRLRETLSIVLYSFSCQCCTLYALVCAFAALIKGPSI